MTENLAGRGEGLADRLTESIWAISDGQHPDKDTLRNLIRNILAAAPAGTAPDTLENDTVHRCADKLNEMRDYGVLGGIAQKLGLPVSDSVAVAIIVHAQELIRALATPSAQAPTCTCKRVLDCPVHGEQSNTFSTTSAREQSSATASDILRVGRAIYLQTKNWTFGISYPQSVDATSWAAEAVRRGLGVEWATDWIHRGYPEVPQWIIGTNQPVVPAATQEPAGSAPIESFTNNMPVITVTDGAPPNASPPSWKQPVNILAELDHEKYAGPMGKIMRAGSPRKVGEDGALKADDYRLVPVCLIQRFGADVPGNEADTRWTVCLPNGDYAHIFPEYLLAQPTPQASSEIREALAELTELKRRMDSESVPKLWSYGTIYAYVVNRIEELLAAAAGVEERR